ncbi:hypothetical protein COU37_03795 [Candidatus Micrarchaeota archaeon CG10_big_fil_rev_8_21_14_0_10_45_29]|nr:MAG: hypothetical protein COU37_03795 [Candidatus Micrarchaeota archaeon CG10_big_fil_rev_8_21_14_0_10_45_29]
MKLKDIEKPEIKAAPDFSGFSQRALSAYLSALKEENYLSLAQDAIKFLSSRTLEQRAEAAKIIIQYAKENKPTGLQKKFLYELALAVAPAHAAIWAQKDFQMDKSVFRKKNGAYKSSTNNCRHYCFKLYYQILQDVLENESLSSKKIHGRPKNFDWKGHNCRIRRMPPQEWDSLDGKDKERYFEGNLAFVAYVFSAKEIDKIKQFIEPGDLVGVDRNPRTSNAHVGICSPDKDIIHIGRPLYKDTVEKLTSKATTVVIYRAASREQKVDISFGALLPLSGEF